MPIETKTPRERWSAVLSRQKPDRIPMDYWATGETNDNLMKHLSCANMEDLMGKLHIDPVVTVSPTYKGPALSADTDIFGCRYRNVDYGTGTYRECVSSPLAGYNSPEEIDRNYRWPSPDWYDYTVIPAQVAGKDNRPVRGGGSEPFLLYNSLSFTAGWITSKHWLLALPGRSAGKSGKTCKFSGETGDISWLPAIIFRRSPHRKVS